MHTSRPVATGFASTLATIAVGAALASLPVALRAQAPDSTLEASRLPIVYLRPALGDSIVVGFKQEADFYLFDGGPGAINRLTDAPALEAAGPTRAFVKYRGSSSLRFPKRNLNLEFREGRTGPDTELALLGMPKHEEWALHAPYSDKSLMRNALAYGWARDIQPWAPRARFCNVVVRERNPDGSFADDYRGVYLATEEVHRDNDRVDLARLSRGDTAGQALTGGYILEVGADVDAGRAFFGQYSQSFPDSVPTQYNFAHPNFDSLAPAQFAYIRDHVYDVERRLAQTSATDDYRSRDNYRAHVDVASWVDHAVLQELTANFDAYRRSMYILKDRDDEGGRFAGGPAWDFNIALGNNDRCLGTRADGWVADRFQTCPKSLPKFVDWMWADPVFRARFRARWEGLRRNTLSDARIDADIDSLAALLAFDQAADEARWRHLGRDVWPNPQVAGTWPGEVAYLRDWIRRRVAWIDANVRAFPTLASLQADLTPLPIVDVATASGDTIPTDRTVARLRVIDNGPMQLNSPDGASTGYDGRVEIELRGDPGAKPDYRLELQDATGADLPWRLLDLPKESDWVLLGPYSDKSLVREALGTELADAAMPWAPRTKPVVLYVNGAYEGVYLLTETVKRDDSRVAIARLNPDEVSGDDLTGGYILEIDGPSANPARGFTSGTYNTFFRYDTPDDDDIAPQQAQYIRGVVDAVERGLASGGYPAIADLVHGEQFAEYMLMRELAAGSKAYRRSGYLYKDKDSNDPRLRAGPVLDFTRSFGNDVECGGQTVDRWVVEDGGRCGSLTQVPGLFRALWADPDFRAVAAARYRELRADRWSDAALAAELDTLTALTALEADANFARYPILGRAIGRNAFVGQTYAEEVAYLRDWLLARARWMDGAIDTVNAIPAAASASDFAVFPNPAPLGGRVELRLAREPDGPLSASLVDPVGHRTPLTLEQGGPTRYVVDLRGVPRGVYTLELATATGRFGAQPIVR